MLVYVEIVHIYFFQGFKAKIYAGKTLCSVSLGEVQLRGMLVCAESNSGQC